MNELKEELWGVRHRVRGTDPITQWNLQNEITKACASPEANVIILWTEQDPAHPDILLSIFRGGRLRFHSAASVNVSMIVPRDLDPAEAERWRKIPAFSRPGWAATNATVIDLAFSRFDGTYEDFLRALALLEGIEGMPSTLGWFERNAGAVSPAFE
jgi:hypothetical protein